MMRCGLGVHTWLLFAMMASVGLCGGCGRNDAPRALAKSATFDVYVVSTATPPTGLKAVDPTGATIYLTLPPVITSADVATVQLSKNQPGIPGLMVNLTAAGAPKLAAATAPAAGLQLALVANGKVISVAKVNSPLSTGFEVSGGAVEKDGQHVFDSLTME